MTAADIARVEATLAEQRERTLAWISNVAVALAQHDKLFARIEADQAEWRAEWREFIAEWRAERQNGHRNEHT